MENFNLKKFLVENKLTTNSRILKENLHFDYQDSQTGARIVMNDDTKDAILDNPQLQDFITPKHFVRNNKGEVVLGVDWMDYDEFDKLANFLGIKY